MIKKSKLTKKIWFEGELWDLVDVIQPNKYDDFLLLKTETDCVHEDGSPAMDMVVVHAQDHEFYPNTKEVREKMEEINKARKEFNSTCTKHRTELDRIWLRCFSDSDWI